jgi:hypothetical protein
MHRFVLMTGAILLGSCVRPAPPPAPLPSIGPGCESRPSIRLEGWFAVLYGDPPAGGAGIRRFELQRPGHDVVQVEPGPDIGDLAALHGRRVELIADSATATPSLVRACAITILPEGLK